MMMDSSLSQSKAFSVSRPFHRSAPGRVCVREPGVEGGRTVRGARGFSGSGGLAPPVLLGAERGTLPGTLGPAGASGAVHT